MVTEPDFDLRSYVENLPGFRSFELEPRQGAKPEDFIAWNTTNAPFELPDDLAGFLEAADGLSLRWRALSLNAEVVVVGSLAISGITELARLGDAPPASSPGRDFFSPHNHRAAFALDFNPKV